MAKNRATNIPSFNPNQTLKSIRENSLNPVIERVQQVQTNIESVIAPTQRTVYKNVIFDEGASTLTFEKVGKDDAVPQASTVIDLSSIVPQFAGIDIKGYSTHSSALQPGSGEAKSISKIKFEDADISKDTTDVPYAKVVYQWDKIVPAYQKDQTVNIPDATTGTATGPYDSLEVVGAGAPVYFTYTKAAIAEKKGTVRINMPLIPEQQTASVHSKPGETDKPFTKIKITGNIGGSTIDGDELQIDLPSGGARTARYFEGFYNSVDDIKVAVLTPTEDRSSAYVKSEKDGVIYYTLHMFSNSDWRPVGTVPSLIYKGNGTAGSPDQGVVSIKHDDYIKLSSTGELDLSELGKHGSATGNEYFMGIYDSEDDMKKIPNPTANKTYAILRNNTAKNGYLPYSYRQDTAGTGDPQWRLTPSLGHLMYVVGDGTSPENYTPIYGIKGVSPNWKVNERGVLELAKYPKGSLAGTIQGAGTIPTVTGNIKSIRYTQGSSNVYLNADTGLLDIYPAQTVVAEFNDDWQTLNKTENFLGKIYFDKTNNKWIGMTSENPDKPWTHIAHKGMSDEVTSLAYRLPPETPKVTPVSSEDDRWKYSGNTYLEKEDADLPTEIKSICGGFIQTDIKEDSTTTDITKKVRTQTCHADDGSGKVFMRAYDIATTKWKDWIKTSFTPSELHAHDIDPLAHRAALKSYRIFCIKGKILDINNQTVGGSPGGMTTSNGTLLFDNSGYSNIRHSYLDAPYDGKYRLRGVASFSGYKEKDSKTVYPAGRWQILIRKLNPTTSTYSPVAQFTYDHSDEKMMYPTLGFEGDGINLKRGEQLITNFTFSAIGQLGSHHPDLYLVPTRSYFLIEDTETHAGSFITQTFRLLFGNLDVNGDVGIKSHHTDFDTNKSIRVYGEKIDKNPTIMAKTITP
ncbi:MAG: hypothetical protein ACRC6V_02310 [Bacteroidales bacterium]